ncbi:conserved Plasmodium protein, unknown function [Plasmodium gallinaceum]|uniref:Uncharacterized protein n=1 Tax=Plasmodium gallinaceum TaxID=5849 RepID=A0A1J1H0L6_PLAGA|nr:conserved Plasmodium protein, unknown function [Plasmodium gallinaceum]CRG98107.1 conserved Plasmodium protein, unknown function [Plasmodium gallinaceum]
MYKNTEEKNTYFNEFNLKSNVCCDFISSSTFGGDQISKLKNKLFNCNNSELIDINNSKDNGYNDIENNNNNNNELLHLLDNINYLNANLYYNKNKLQNKKNITSFEDKSSLSQHDYLNIKKSKLINNLNFFMRVCCNKKSYIKFINHYFNIIYSNNINILFQYECILQKFEENNENLTENDYYNAYINLNKIPLHINENVIIHGKNIDINNKQENIRNNNLFENNIISFLNVYDNLTVNFFNHIFNKMNNDSNMQSSHFDNIINNFLHKKNLLKENIFNILLNISKSYEIKYSDVISDIKNEEYLKDGNEKKILEILKNKIDREANKLNKINSVTSDYKNNTIHLKNTEIYINNKNNDIKNKDNGEIDNYCDGITNNINKNSSNNNDTTNNNENVFLEEIKEKLNKEIEIYDNNQTKNEEVDKKKNINTIDNIYKFLKNNIFIPNNNIYTDFVENGNDIFLNKIKKSDKNAYFKLIEKFDRMYNIINEFKNNIKNSKMQDDNLNNDKENIQKNKKKKNDFNEYEFKVNNQTKRCLRNCNCKKNKKSKRSKRIKKIEISKNKKIKLEDKKKKN